MNKHLNKALKSEVYKGDLIAKIGILSKKKDDLTNGKKTTKIDIMN